MECGFPLLGCVGRRAFPFTRGRAATRMRRRKNRLPVLATPTSGHFSRSTQTMALVGGADVAGGQVGNAGPVATTASHAAATRPELGGDLRRRRHGIPTPSGLAQSISNQETKETRRTNRQRLAASVGCAETCLRGLRWLYRNASANGLGRFATKLSTGQLPPGETDASDQHEHQQDDQQDHEPTHEPSPPDFDCGGRSVSRSHRTQTRALTV